MTRALDLFRSAIEPIRVKPGCRGCYMLRDAAEEGSLRYTEEWTSADAFRRHVRSEEFWPILIAMDLCAAEPQVRIGDLIMRGGLDLLLQLREAPPLDSKETTDPLALEPREGR
jgi:quinol monooxygenase YgiN